MAAVKNGLRALLLRPAFLVGLAVLVHLIALHALDAAGIMDRLLAPSGFIAVVWAAIGACFIFLRLFLILFGAGLLLGDLAWLAGQYLIRSKVR